MQLKADEDECDNNWEINHGDFYQNNGGSMQVTKWEYKAVNGEAEDVWTWGCEEETPATREKDRFYWWRSMRGAAFVPLLLMHHTMHLHHCHLLMRDLGVRLMNHPQPCAPNASRPTVTPMLRHLCATYMRSCLCSMTHWDEVLSEKCVSNKTY